MLIFITGILLIIFSILMAFTKHENGKYGYEWPNIVYTLGWVVAGVVVITHELRISL